MFIAKNNDLIVLAKDTLEELKEGLKFIKYTSIEETDEDYVLYRGQICTIERQTELETNFINHLTMTALDIISLVKSMGVSDEAILQYLQDNPTIQLQLTFCKDVYCGVVRQLCPIKITEDLIITDDIIVKAFKQKYNLD